MKVDFDYHFKYSFDLNFKKLFLIGGIVVLAGYGAFYQINKTLAEQSGGSPESGEESVFNKLTQRLDTLGYGSTAPSSLGDYGGGLE